jgi:uncharacterized protein (TIGR00369 family)
VTVAPAEAARTRTVTWGDPVDGARRGLRLSGLEYLRAMMDGDLPAPPIMATLGFELVEIGDGRAVFACDPGEHHMNPLGSVHGGLAATLLDSATGAAVHTTLPAGSGYTTLDLQVRFVRPIGPGSGRVTAYGEVLHTGRRVATAQGRLVDETGRLLAHATASCLLLRDGS